MKCHSTPGPDFHADIGADGLSNGKGSDMRKNFPNDELSGDPYRNFMGICDEQYKELEGEVNKTHTWRYTNTCASCASETLCKITGVDIDADDVVGVETPKEIGSHILEVSSGKESNEADPAPVQAQPQGRTSSK